MTNWVRVCATTILAMTALSVSAAPNEAPPEAKTTSSRIIVQPAIDGIFESFYTHPLVGLGDDHGLEQGMEFYSALVSDPRFARDVGNVVVEFGTAGHQGVVDRYLAGDTVPYTELRSIWTDTVGWIPPAGYLGFAKFLAAVRETNKALPPARHIRVWLGDPPVDWSAPTRSELMNAMNSRDSYPANLIEHNILAQGKKALVIYGHMHFGAGGTLGGRIEATHPGTLYILLPYSGIHHPSACSPLLQRAAKVWPSPALATPARGAVPDTAMRECATYDAYTFDGVLFFGPLETLAKGPYLPDYVLDTQLRREMARRSQIGGPPLVRFPAGLSLRKADYQVDLDAPGFAELVDAMFAEFDRDHDGIVTAEEYVDPIPP